MKKIYTPFLFLISCVSAFAQSADSSEKPPGLTISGYVDVYYKYNFNENLTDNKTSFTNSHNSFELGMASIKLEHSYKKASFVADLGFGKRAEEFSYNDANTRFAIKQLNLGYQITSKFKLSMGSFATHIGYEVVDPYLNRNYSMSYMFTNGPFFNTGVKADFTLGEWNIMLGVFNPTDFKTAIIDGKLTNHKYIGAQLGYAPAKIPFKAYLNYLEGKDTSNIQNHQIDLVLTYQLSSKFGLGYNGTVSAYSASGMSSKSWGGSALYLNYDCSSAFGLTLRTDYFSDKKDLKVYAGTPYVNGGSVLAFTLSGNYKVGQLTIVPEIRLDNASEPIFNKSNGSPVKSTGNLLLAAYYKF